MLVYYLNLVNVGLCLSLANICILFKFRFENIGIFLIDDVSIEDTNPINLINEYASISISTYPNPASNILSIAVSGNLNIVRYSILSTHGIERNMEISVIIKLT